MISASTCVAPRRTTGSVRASPEFGFAARTVGVLLTDSLLLDCLVEERHGAFSCLNGVEMLHCDICRDETVGFEACDGPLDCR